MKTYQPSQTILNKYAQVLVNYALNSGQGIKLGEVVLCGIPDVAKPLGLALQNTILKAGGQPLIRLLPTGFDKDFYRLANKQQLTFFPQKYLRAKTGLIDHSIRIIADPDPEELKTIDPKKIVLARDSKKDYQDWLTAKELKGKFTWTLALWGTAAKAKIVGLSLKQYWQQIIKACFLNQAEPVKAWQKTVKLQQQIKSKLNQLRIDWLEITGPEVNLRLKLGADRIWVGGSGRNIPSFELFSSPDWRGTEGWIKFNQPVYRYGNLIKGIRLEFKQGQVVKGQAKQGNNLLQVMLKSPNANKLGEVSLTDNRLSKITHPMAEILYDENISGPHGNCHVAIGKAYKDCYRGQAKTLTKDDWFKRGFNDSAEHTDMITTSKRQVVAKLVSGEKQLIYKNGQFKL